MIGLFKVVFYTKGSFVKDPKLRYEGGNIFAFNGQDTDFWLFFEARDLIKRMNSAFTIDEVKMRGNMKVVVWKKI